MMDQPTKPIYGNHLQTNCNKCQPITFDTIEEQMNRQQKFIEKVLKELEGE